MISTYLEAKTGIVVTTLEGDLSEKEIMEWIRSVSPEKLSVTTLKMLINASDAQFLFKPDILEELDHAIRTQSVLFKKVFVAVVLNTPYETAISTIVENKTVVDNYTHKSFALKENALYWLEAQKVTG
jgi:hypothetical protein